VEIKVYKIYLLHTEISFERFSKNINFVSRFFNALLDHCSLFSSLRCLSIALTQISIVVLSTDESNLSELSSNFLLLEY
jgi:hypothetical protein